MKKRPDGLSCKIRPVMPAAVRAILDRKVWVAAAVCCAVRIIALSRFGAAAVDGGPVLTGGLHCCRGNGGVIIPLNHHYGHLPRAVVIVEKKT